MSYSTGSGVRLSISVRTGFSSSSICASSLFSSAGLVSAYAAAALKHCSACPHRPSAVTEVIASNSESRAGAF